MCWTSAGKTRVAWVEENMVCKGSVSGRLERLNIHNRSEFALYPPLGGFSITCIFPEEMFDQVYAAIRNNVTVFGELSFKPDNPFPERVHVKSIEVHPKDEDLPRLADMRGLWKGATNGLGSVEFLTANRDE